MIGKIIRYFRLLAIIQEIKVLRKNMSAFLKTIVSISKVLFQIVFLLIFCSIFGLHLFYGLLESRCRLTPYPVDDEWIANPNITTLCGYGTCPEE